MRSTTKWEYSIYCIREQESVYVYRGYKDLFDHQGRMIDTLRQLDNLGADGWEVIDIKFGEGCTTYHLKRPVSED